MIKYIIYADDENHPGKQNVIKKIKNNEYEALSFVGDVRNLSKYGYFTLVKKTDDGVVYTWDAQGGVWTKPEEVPLE